jgi:hypothetical protein
MTSQNPYTPPPSTTPGEGQYRYERLQALDGHLYIPMPGGTLPARCVKCNAETSYSTRRTLAWHPSWVYIALPFSFGLLYILLALYTRETITVRMGLCPLHQRKNAWAIGLALASMCLCIVGCTAGPGEGAGVVGSILLFFGFFVSALFALHQYRVLEVHAIDTFGAKVTVGKAYLESFE